jgi:hypothetical protein
MLSPTILVDGQVAGTWSRSLKRGSVALTSNWFAQPNTEGEEAYGAAARRYGVFLGLPSVRLPASPRLGDADPPGGSN